MTKDIYKWRTRKALKGEILKLKLTYNELFDNMLKTQQENKELKKAYNICVEKSDIDRHVVMMYGFDAWRWGKRS